VRVSAEGIFVVVKTRRSPFRMIGIGAPSSAADFTESGTKIPKAFFSPADVNDSVSEPWLANDLANHGLATREWAYGPQTDVLDKPSAGDHHHKHSTKHCDEPLNPQPIWRDSRSASEVEDCAEGRRGHRVELGPPTPS
jgi:hypothetical protein